MRNFNEMCYALIYGIASQWLFQSTKTIAVEEWVKGALMDDKMAVAIMDYNTKNIKPTEVLFCWKLIVLVNNTRHLRNIYLTKQW